MKLTIDHFHYTANNHREAFYLALDNQDYAMAYVSVLTLGDHIATAMTRSHRRGTIKMMIEMFRHARKHLNDSNDTAALLEIAHDEMAIHGFRCAALKR